MASQSIKQEIRLDRARNFYKVTLACSVGLTICFVLGAIAGLGFGGIAIMNVLALVLLLIATFFFDPNSTFHTWLTLASYAALTAIEVLLFGIPDVLIEIERGISKGLLMEAIFYLLPYIYLGIRVAMIVPILNLAIVTSHEA